MSPSLLADLLLYDMYVLQPRRNLLIPHRHLLRVFLLLHTGFSYYLHQYYIMLSSYLLDALAVYLYPLPYVDLSLLAVLRIPHVTS